MSQGEFFRQANISQLLAVFSQVAKGLGIDYFVIGALARDIRLSAIPEHASRRATKDVDIAIMVGSEVEFEQVKQALVATGDFTAHGTLAIKLFYKQAIEVDLLPFGQIEGLDGEVRVNRPWPFVLDVPGFKEVLPTATTLTIGAVEIRVCSLEGIILLKLFANDDNPARTKDVSDIEHILKAYFNLATEAIFADFTDVPDLYSTADPEYLTLVSARVVGRIMNNMLSDSPALRMRLRRILQGKTPNRYWPEMSAGLEDE
ncbi:MAG: nucleotidyl transferase AbiEii/AbiGii toxin family protein [Bacteroidetes bacterium]|nr:nucleotidyl transferase AbiEii/AbiGii toxin family protein [Bacteroidota bacterium]